MSIIKLLFWPEQAISEDKYGLIIDSLIDLQVIQNKRNTNADNIFDAGANIEKYMPGFTYANSKRQISIKVWPVFSVAQINKQASTPQSHHNVVEFVNVDHSLDDWEMMLQTLETITSDDYQAGWEDLYPSLNI